MTTILFAVTAALVLAVIGLLVLLLIRQGRTRRLVDDLLVAHGASRTNMREHAMTMAANLAVVEKNLRESGEKAGAESAKLAESMQAGVSSSLQMVSSQLVELSDSQKAELQCLTRQLDALTVSTEARIEELRASLEQRMAVPAAETRERLEELRAMVETNLKRATEVSELALDETNMAVSQLQQLVHSKLSDALAVQRSQVDSVFERLDVLKETVEERVAAVAAESERRTAESFESFQELLKVALDGVTERLAGAQARNEASMDTLRTILDRGVSALRETVAESRRQSEGSIGAFAVELKQEQAMAAARADEASGRQERRLDALAAQVAGLVEQESRLAATIEQRIAGRLAASESSLRDTIRTAMRHGEETTLAVQQLRTAVDAAVPDRTQQESRLDALAGQLTSLADTYSRLITGVDDRLRQNRAATESDLKELAGIAIQRNEETVAAVDKLRESMVGQAADVAAQTEARFNSLLERWNGLVTSVDEKLARLQGSEEAAQRTLLESQKGEIAAVLSDYQVVVERNAADVQAMAEDFTEFRRALTELKATVESMAARQLAPVPSEPRPAASAAPGRTGYALSMPGGDGRPGEMTWLPIDARYPVGIFERLTRARKSGDAPAAIRAEQELEDSILAWAKSIRDKYAGVPNTADFSIMFLPTEELHAEILQRANLCRILHRDFRVVIAGPSTLETLLADTGRRTTAGPRIPTVPPTPLP